MYKYICRYCKKPFEHQNKNRQCCSRTCGGQYKRYNGPLFIWKEGYCFMLPDISHPRKNRFGRVLRSHLIMEQSLGRYLTKNEVVHHKDKKMWHDIEENLVVMTRGEHTSFHNKERIK